MDGAAPSPPERLPPWRGLVVLLGGEGVQRALSFAAVWLVARRLPSADFAPVEVALSALMFGALVVELGFPLLAAREVARDRGAETRLFGPVVALQLAAAALLVALAWGGRAAGMLGPELGRLLPIYALSLLLLPWLAPWSFQGRGEMEWVAAPGVLRQALFLAGVALLVHGSDDLALLPWAEVAAVGGAALLAQAARRRRLARERQARPAAPSMPRPAPVALLAEAAPMGLSQLLWVLRMYLATLLLWRLVPQKESVSNYAVAHRVMMVMQAVLTMYFTNLYPGLARAARGAREALRRLLLRSSALAVGGALALALAVAAGAEPLLALLWKPEFCNAESAACLRALAFVLPLLACRGHARMTLIALGRGRLELACSVAGSVALAALIPWWTARDGAVGAAEALLAAEGLGLLLTVFALCVAWRTGGRIEPMPAGGA
jgi:O-antigen/teichoic acid export membrane protein